MRVLRRRGARLLIGAVAVAALAAAMAAFFPGQSAAGRQKARQIRLTVRLTGPAPTQQTGGLPGSPGTAPGGPAEPGHSRHGVFTMTGALHDHGTVVFRLPPLGSSSQESIVELHSRRGSLRLALSGGGESTTAGRRGQARWHVVSGRGHYIAATGGGTLTQSPETIVLSGALILRGR